MQTRYALLRTIPSEKKLKTDEKGTSCPKKHRKPGDCLRNVNWGGEVKAAGEIATTDSNPEQDDLPPAIPPP